MKTIPVSKVKSSQIHAIGHDADSNTLAVQFHGKGGVPGAIYHYANVSADQHAEMLKDDSIGSHFGKHFKQNPKHPFTRLPEQHKKHGA